MYSIRKYIMNQYEINEKGVIITPGKFEGEQIYVPYFWELFLNGEADEDDGEVIRFNVTEIDRSYFPELKDSRYVDLIEKLDGFVYEI